MHALGRAVEHDVGDGLRRHGDDGEVDLVGHVLHGLVRRQPGHRLGLGVHRVDAALVVAEHEVAHHRLADRVLPAARADDGDAAGGEDALDRRRLGALLAGPHDADGGVGGLDRNASRCTPSSTDALDLVAHLAEDLQHPVVGRQDLRDESPDAALAAGLREVLEQQLADAAALVRVLDEERHLCLVVGDRVVASDADDEIVERDHERHPAVEVDVGEALDVLRRELRVRREEADVLGLVGDARVELDQALGVIGHDGSQLGDPAVLEQDVGVPLRVVGGGVAHGPQPIGWAGGAGTAWQE